MRKTRFATGYAAIWLLVAIAFAFALAMNERDMTWPRALVAGVLTALPAAILGLGVLRLCDRFPWRRTSGITLAAVHVAASVAFTTLWSASIVSGMASGAPREAVNAFVHGALAWQLVTGLITYALVAGAAYARAALRGEARQTQATERAEMLRLRAELSALRARLDPHFLFNVLQTIGALVDEQPAKVHTALEYLSALLRRRIDAAGDDTTDGVPLAIELADMREYLALEKLRLGDRLVVTECIDPATVALMIPRFVLQPLVENSIRHGLASQAGGGTLAIETRLAGDASATIVRRGDASHGAIGGEARSHRDTLPHSAWTLIVRDDGGGADMARVASSNGVGLSVLRERLRLRFGSDAALQVDTSPGNGCVVTVRLPVMDE